MTGSARPLLLLLPFFMAGCLFEKEEPEPPDISPLAVGNTWIYVDSAYSETDAAETGTSETSILGTREATIAGKADTVFLVNVHAVGGPPSSFSSYVKNFGHSNYSCGAEDGPARVTAKTLHLEYPTRTGRRYTTFFYGFAAAMGATVPALDTIEIEVVDARATCTVPAGTFACVHYRGYRTDGSVYADAYHAPGVGYLGYEITRTASIDGVSRETRSVRRLVSYALH